MTTPPTRTRGSRVAVDWLMVVASAAVTLALVFVGASGFPFELSGRLGPRPRAARFWEYTNGGDPVWFADHIAWFALAGALLAVTVTVAATPAFPRLRRARQLMLVGHGAAAVITVGVFFTLLASWIAGLPASSSESFASPIFYVLPTIVSGVLAVVSVGLTLLARHIGVSRRR